LEQAALRAESSWLLALGADPEAVHSLIARLHAYTAALQAYSVTLHAFHARVCGP